MLNRFANRFIVLSVFADLQNKVSGVYDLTDEGGLLWNDPNVVL